jgi:CheY-specific phosphatase CheX
MTNVSDDDVREVTTSVWSTVSELDLLPSDPAAVPDAAAAVMAGCVHVTGAFTGAIALLCSDGLARRVAAGIFDVESALVTLEQTQDAIGELVNMTGGNIKALLPEPSMLSLPAVAQGMEFTARVPGSRVLSRVAFACAGELLVVTVHEKDDRPLARRGTP